MEKKKIPIEGEYYATEDGKIFNNKKELFGCNNKRGYKVTKIKTKQWRTHRLIALTFIPNPENKSEVNHINGIKNDNRVENLEWVTGKENMIHARDILKKEFGVKGEKQPNHVLNEINVRQIRELNNKGLSIGKLSKKYKIARSTLSNVINKRTWKHI